SRFVGSTNLNVTLRTNMTNGNWSIQNVTFRFVNKTGVTGQQVYNTTVFNGTPNPAGAVFFQNTSFDTRLLLDGVYDLNVTVQNITTIINNATSTNITIDNTAPFVNVSGLNAGPTTPTIQYGQNFTVNTMQNVSFNATAYDLEPGIVNNASREFELSADNTNHTIYFWFDNGTGNDFNLTPVNDSGKWSVKYNLSMLSGGNEWQTVRVMANDSMSNGTINNRNDSVFWNFTVDRTNPKVTASSSGVTSTAATLKVSTNESVLNCSFSVSNGAGSGVLTGPATSFTSKALVLLPGNDYTATVTCGDFVGNTGTGSVTFTSSAAAAASSGGGGAGGSSGGISTGVQGSFEKKVWASINAGETASVALKNGVVGVTEVSFSVPSKVYGAWINVAKKDKLPSSVSSFNGKVYKNVEITKGPALAKEGAFTDATVKFKVEKTWLAEQKLTKEAVALHHYQNVKWVKLQTQVGEDDGTYVHYNAKTPNFSYFVIGQESGAQAAPVAEAPAEEAVVEAPVAEAPAEEPAMEQKGMSTGLIVALLAALVVVVAVVLYMRKKK
ncbi:MAG: PGF-pre-PGF domain-containing protein, partial [Nanoarchaeota archaeon]|nr:PGF-pre-PGF domain-containing protein [Nanoarchaeota archaeon]